MRTPEVEIAISNTKAGMYCTDDADTLAAEVERLEKRENELINALDMGQINCDAVYDELREEREDAKQRAEAAEARVKELGRDSVNMFDEAKRAQNAEKDALARVAELETQHARLRAALERLDALYISEFDHEDRPPRPQWLKAALNGEEASK